MPETTAPAWWAALYSTRHNDTGSAGTLPVPPRIPPPGQVINLGKTPEPEPAPVPDAPAAGDAGAPDEPKDELGMAEGELVGDDQAAVDDWQPAGHVVSSPRIDRAINERVAAVQQRVANLPGRTRWLAYNGSAAAAGYFMHLAPWCHAQLVACQAASGGDQTAAVILGAGAIAVIWWRWDGPTRTWRGVLPWMCRIPLASAVLALGLYAPGH